MKRPYLLVGGYGGGYSPEFTTEGWIGCYATEQEAIEQVKEVDNGGKTVYEVKGETYDWYDIVNLSEWAD